jgi:hypothetical protein
MLSLLPQLEQWRSEVLETFKLYDVSTTARNWIVEAGSLNPRAADHTLEEIFRAVDHYSRLRFLVRKTISALDVDVSNLRSDLSLTHIARMGDRAGRIRAAATAAEATDSEHITELIATAKRAAPSPQEVQRLFEQWPNSALVYAPLMAGAPAEQIDAAKDLTLARLGIAPRGHSQMQRFGLVPRERADPRLAGFIIEERSTIEYDVQSLRQAPSTAPTSGINKAIMAKWDVIHAIPNPIQSGKRRGGVKGGPIMRTLNGNVFRRMQCDVPLSRIERGPSPRIAAYQHIIAESIVGNLRAPPQPAGSEPPTPLNQVSTRVYRATMEHVEKALAARMPTSLRALNGIFDRTFEQVVGSSIFGSAATTLDRETLPTWLLGVDRVTRGFIRYINDGLARAPLTEKMFREKDSDTLRVALLKTFNTVVKAAIDKTFDAEHDIYGIVNIKARLLKGDIGPL